MTDIRLHIEDSGGDGRPVVLLHGWPLSAESWAAQTAALADLDRVLTQLDLRDTDRETFFDGFATGFFSTAEGLQVSEEQRQEGIRLSLQSHQPAALGAMDAWATTDFRGDLGTITVPTLVLHGDGDQTVPFAGSGARTHETIEHSELHVISGAPHGCNVSHADEFNRALLDFLAR